MKALVQTKLMIIVMSLILYGHFRNIRRKLNYYAICCEHRLCGKKFITLNFYFIA